MNIINSKEANSKFFNCEIACQFYQDQNIQAFTLKYREEEVSKSISLARGADSPRQQCRLGLLTVQFTKCDIGSKVEKGTAHAQYSQN